MKKFFYKKRIFITISLLFSISLITLSFVRIDYDITSPGNINEVNSVISVDSQYEQKGSFNTTSVYVNERTSILKYLFAHLSKSNIIEKSSEIVYRDDIRNSKSGVIQKNISIYNSIICAYAKAGKYLDYQYEGIIIHTLTKYATLDLEVGDIISKVAGESFNNSTEFLSLYNKARTNEEYYKKEEGICYLPLTVNGEDKIVKSQALMTADDGSVYPVFGFEFYDYHSINEETANPQFTLKDAITEGPSGGLMQSLSIYNALTEFDYTYGLKIAGTGTIEIDGTVGAIGGMYSKIFTAYYEDVDIFFVPYYESTTETNYQEALRAYEALGKPEDFIIVPVRNFDEAVNYLIGIGEAND